ncbi:MAG: acylneuraminate cytidylyltransferase family protein [Bacteroidales bacterium]|nr:acylneuraminate cytidylyltransferase family protein [Bacteroidales bacterium]
MTPLIIIPARGGSKGIPYKNIKLLNGKPLICYSIDIARQYTTDDNICVTTDDKEIISVVEQYGLKVPFVRPAELATDTAPSNDVLVHALNFYESQGRQVDVIILLQPTSPFRKVSFVKEAVELYNEELDMVVSVKETSANPYYNCFEEDKNGFLSISKSIGHPITRRQDAPKVWEYNGSIYVINPTSLKDNGMQHFTRVKKYPMSELYSVDIDCPFDWKVAELLLNENMIEL